MRKLVYLLAISAIVALAGCTKDNGSDTEIDVTNGQLEQVVYADNITGNGGVSFTTNGPWTSSITSSAPANTAAAKAAAQTPQWLSITPDHGDAAGAYTINITLDANYTGEKRTATITISCNGQTITITVTQQATANDGTTPQPKLISQLLYTTDNNVNTSVTFTYDDKNRVTKMKIIAGWQESIADTIVLDYVYSAGKLNVHALNDGWAESDTEGHLKRYKSTMDIDATLNAQGYINKATYTYNTLIGGDGHESGPDVVQIEYNTDGYFTKSTHSVWYWTSSVSSDEGGGHLEEVWERKNYELKYTPTWLAGNMTVMNFSERDKGAPTSEYNPWLVEERATYSGIQNNTNLDISQMLGTHRFQSFTGEGMLGLLGLCGKHNANLPSRCWELPSNGSSTRFSYDYSYQVERGFVTKIMETQTIVYNEQTETENAVITIIYK